MDYEQKYKDALKRAKKLQETCDSTTIVGWCEYIFPELKESEDEKIKRELRNDLLLYVPTPERYISWIEKQGHMLDTDKVIEWLNNQACQGWIEDVEVDKFVDKLKKDFGL